MYRPKHFPFLRNPIKRNGNLEGRLQISSAAQNHCMSVPLNSFPSRMFFRFARSFPATMTVMPYASASLAATGSKGAFMPGFHSEPTSFRKSFHASDFSGFASLNFLGSLS